MQKILFVEEPSLQAPDGNGGLQSGKQAIFKKTNVRITKPRMRSTLLKDKKCPDQAVFSLQNMLFANASETVQGMPDKGYSIQKPLVMIGRSAYLISIPTIPGTPADTCKAISSGAAISFRTCKGLGFPGPSRIFLQSRWWSKRYICQTSPPISHLASQSPDTATRSCSHLESTCAEQN